MVEERELLHIAVLITRGAASVLEVISVPREVFEFLRQHQFCGIRLAGRTDVEKPTLVHTLS